MTAAISIASRHKLYLESRGGLLSLLTVHAGMTNSHLILPGHCNMLLRTSMNFWLKLQIPQVCAQAAVVCLPLSSHHFTVCILHFPAITSLSAYCTFQPSPHCLHTALSSHHFTVCILHFPAITSLSAYCTFQQHMHPPALK